MTDSVKHVTFEVSDRTQTTLGIGVSLLVTLTFTDGRWVAAQDAPRLPFIGPVEGATQDEALIRLLADRLGVTL